ncbi:hypothetical protein fugu_015198 [Takifugu bimaculatus]|uniref:Uncharacterized protein n=1 Tax=Takifugu bimaculatus TaxID=433685 RepID=A0A4Z2BYB5_9TELE|nr:hypothetical protein fugu_015198 [Takifugu bimaculatus]
MQSHGRALHPRLLLSNAPMLMLASRQARTPLSRNHFLLLFCGTKADLPAVKGLTIFHSVSLNGILAGVSCVTMLGGAFQAQELRQPRSSPRHTLVPPCAFFCLISTHKTRRLPQTA